MKHQFYTLDVFTDQKFGGNPLAVVMDAARLTGDKMQVVAREFNLSETVFVMPAEAQQHRANIRIFTPFKELPFAGHPTVGTAILLAGLDGMDAGQSLVLEEQVGNVVCDISKSGGKMSALFELPKLPVHRALQLDREVLSKAIGLDQGQIGISGHENTICDAGVPFPIVPIANLEAINSIAINNTELANCMAGSGAEAEVFVYTKECVNADGDYHTRLFAPAFGIPEDPATGSAVAAMAAQIMAFDHPGDGQHMFVIEQGYEMGRPSRIELHMNVVNGVLEKAAISGGAVVISEGTISL